MNILFYFQKIDYVTNNVYDTKKDEVLEKESSP